MIKKLSSIYCVIVFCLTCVTSFAQGTSNIVSKHKSGGVCYNLNLDTHEAEVVYDYNTYFQKTHISVPATITYKDEVFNVTSLAHEAFKSCSFLSVSLPEGLKEIKGRCFYNCSGLETLDIPESVTILGDSVFMCSGLKNIKLPKNIRELPPLTFARCLKMKTFHFLPEIRKIGDECFAYTILEEVDLPVGLKKLGKSAFWRCENLKRVYFHSYVDTIPNSCFYDCVKLSDVNLYTESGEMVIRREAFNNCKSLTSMVFPEGVKFIDSYSLGYSDHRYIMNYYFKSETPPTIDDYSIMLKEGASIYVPDNAVDTYKAAKHWSELASYIKPMSEAAPQIESDGIVYELDMANSRAKILKVKTLPADNILRIDYQVYYSGGAYYIEQIAEDAMSDVNVAGIYLMHGFDKPISDKVFPDKSIPVYVGEDYVDEVKKLDGWSSFTNFVSPDDCLKTRTIDGLVYLYTTLDKFAMLVGDESYASLTELTIPGIVKIDGINCEVSYIDNGCFQNATNLKFIYLDSVKHIELGSDAFASDDIPVYMNDALYYSMEYQDSNWAKHPINRVAMAVIDYPDSKSNLRYNLNFVYHKATVTTYYMRKDEYHIPEEIEHDGITYTVNEMEQKALSDRNGILKLVEIPGTIAEISEEAFKDDKYLSKLILHEGIKSIGRYAFGNNTSLEIVTLPASIDSIAPHAFDTCKNLKHLIIKATTPPVDADNIFWQTWNGGGELPIPIIVPDEAYDAYIAADNFKNRTIQKFSEAFTIVNIGGINYKINVATKEVLVAATDKFKTEKTVEIPKSISYGGYDFEVTGLTEDCFAAGQPQLLKLNSEKPLAAFETSFANYDTKVFVPEESVTAYRNADVWKKFGKNITPEAVNVLVDDMLFRIDFVTEEAKKVYGGSLENNNKSQSVTIPENIEYDEKQFPVTALGGRGFYNWYTVKNFSIPSTVKEFGDSCFYSCRSLREMTVPEKVEKIGKFCFGFCTQITSVKIGKSVKQIGKDVLYYDSNLTSLVIDEENPYFDSRDNCNAIISSASNKLILGSPTAFVPETVDTIGYEAFARIDNITELNTANVKVIEGNAFSSCRGLEKLVFGPETKSLGNYILLGVQQLKRIESYAVNPPECSVLTFTYFLNQKSCELGVLDNSVDAYKEATGWKDFYSITSAETVVSDKNKFVISPDAEVEVYNISGVLIYKGIYSEIMLNEKGIFIVKSSEGTIKLVR